jgi:hypothetical protein
MKNIVIVSLQFDVLEAITKETVLERVLGALHSTGALEDRLRHSAAAYACGCGANERPGIPRHDPRCPLAIPMSQETRDMLHKRLR